MTGASPPLPPGVIPFREESTGQPSLPNRYVLREDEEGRFLTCLEAPNVSVRLERGMSISPTAARKSSAYTIFLDGAAQGEPFMDVQRKVYNLDHHEGCVRAFTLATCEQAMVLIMKGLDLREGDWCVYGNEPDLDTVLAIWILLNTVHLTKEDPEIRRRLMPIVRLQGIIDAHGLELAQLSGFPDYLQEETQSVIDTLRAEEVELKRSGRWQSQDVLEYTAGILRTIDEVVYSPGHFVGLRDIEELARVPIARNRIAVVCRSDVGVYEVEQYLRRLYGDRVGVLILQKDATTYTLRLVDPFLPTSLEPLYDRLNQLEPRRRGNSRWGGSAEIGGSPRGVGTGLNPKQLARVCQWVFQPPPLRRRLGMTLAHTGLVGLVVVAALVGGFAGLPGGPFPGLLTAAEVGTNGVFGLSLAAMALVCLLLVMRRRPVAQFGLRMPAGFGWLALLPVALLAAVGGGAWGAQGPDGLIDRWRESGWLVWVGLPLGIVAAELLFRGALHGRLVGLFRIERPGGGWSVSVPNAVSAVVYAGALVLLFLPPAWLGVGVWPGRLLMFAAALLLSLTCGIARERWGSVIPAIGLHLVSVAAVWIIPAALG